MTLDKSTISLRDVFSAGQAYVALSRVRSLQYLHLLDFNPSVISCDIKVCQFYEAKFNMTILPPGVSATPRDPEAERKAAEARKKMQEEERESQVAESEEEDEEDDK
jgi:hypothetical protein